MASDSGLRIYFTIWPWNHRRKHVSQILMSPNKDICAIYHIFWKYFQMWCEKYIMVKKIDIFLMLVKEFTILELGLFALIWIIELCHIKTLGAQSFTSLKADDKNILCKKKYFLFCRLIYDISIKKGLIIVSKWGWTFKNITFPQNGM